ncbi:MAG: Protein translocase subunit SecA [Parcubacteria group bacterium GW2011_GWA1_38_7]|nr:MAG: Protein translocase subunit SecA [Parcubacteria group bacterium GW2011_GWA1_38_7]
MFNFLTKFLDLNQKEVDRLQKTVVLINSQEDKIKKLKTEDFKKKTEEYKKRIEKGESLESILPESYALVREATYRTLGMRHFDVQMMAATALFEGRVAEQKTGEGKTLSAVPALYLRALTGKGSHLVTVNDYLARRDAGWNGEVFDALGLTVGVIVGENKSYIYDPNYTDDSHGDTRLSHLKQVTRKESYAADITYGTNNEFGFDYLRDNMVGDLFEMVQRGHYFAIVDEVDSILIDEARTPLIISAPDTEPTKKYYEFSQLVQKLNPDTDFKIDEKAKSASLTEVGIAKVEKILKIDNLYEKDFQSIHHIENALRARSLYLIDRDYVVKDNQVIIVDEFTGRLMVGRRWSDGLHQAVEAKEGVVIQQESKTLATISFQNYFRMYDHLSGMTGTAATEAEEFKKIYKLEVVVIPTHRDMVRRDIGDIIYKNLRAKYTAIVNDIEERYKNGQPVLVGTTSIDKNEIISQYLKNKKIPHNVLNAKNHEKEAAIIADAGKPKGVTVATNMAGRGVDIILGGSKPENKKDIEKWEKLHQEVIESGGLHVIGTERHESRRIDNQLRGRAGRQGDAGSSRFYLSLEDDLMRIFGGEQIKSLMDRLKIPEDQPIENSLVAKAVEQSQVKVEGFHFDTRKRLVEFDDVANQQREIVYKLRRKVLESSDLKNEILEKLTQKATSLSNYQDKEMILAGFLEVVPFDEVSIKGFKKEIVKHDDPETLAMLLTKVVTDAHTSREKQVGIETMRKIEKFAYLGSIDHLWIDHIDTVDDLREAIGLRAYGQRDPLVEFKSEAYQMFETLLDRIDDEFTRRIFRVGISERPHEIPLERAVENIDKTDLTGLSQPQPTKNTSQPNNKKLGRNSPCWCGSGKKFKHCHYPELR